MSTRPEFSTDAPIPDDHRACLSALADGDTDAADRACSRWRDDPEARRTWHAYHLIGDVMRSDELAATPAHDASFMAALRQRLAQEPVVLAPAVVPARRQPWLLPVAAAAGFVMVTGVLVSTRSAAPDAAGGGVGAGAPQMAIAERAAPGRPVLSTASGAQSLVTVANPSPSLVAAEAARSPLPVLVRDPRLDDYLRAHQAAGGMAAATPGGWLRRVDSRVSQPPER